MPKIGILLTNTGTPEAPTPSAVRRYLREFLSDKRVVQLPRIIWLPILYGLVLTFRPYRSAKLYEKIWTKKGSPMRILMQQLANNLQNNSRNIAVEIGMNYGNPSIKEALQNFSESDLDKIIVIPLFPQYSYTTTASSFDRLHKALRKWPQHPEIIKIENYFDNQHYIQALASSVRQAWNHHPAQHLLISFHGIPKRFVDAGDPYQHECEQTAKLLASELKLPADKWTLCYQSQFGYDKWLKPSTQELFLELPKRGIKNIDVICPGFSVDCLETLEEIAIKGRETFQHSGGESLRYIPALNDSDEHIQMLLNILREFQ